MIIIGITGTIGAGKGTIVDYLMQKCGFRHYSVRQYLLDVIQKAGLEPNRDSMTMVGNALRAAHCPSFITDELYLQALQSGKDSIIESVRTEGEVLALRQKPHFYLFAVDADPKIRYERVVLRNSETDHIDYETFISNEQREFISTDPNRQNLSKCIQMADFLFQNNGDRDALYAQVDAVMAQIRKEMEGDKPAYVRPSWDEYFMEICNTVAKRATCDRGRSGCVVVKDRQILVTGYVGSPVGMPHCDEVGHQLKQMVHEDGSVTTHCTRTVHAEQNAICQAAKRGISLKGATLYCRMTPCRTCAMMIINCGIVRVVCERKYHAGAESEAMFKQAGIELLFMHDEVLQYNQQ
ncbi:MAG: AAA family ATPase [Bacteroidales bacterium]|nr:AAA family ATPase [Bacteroidales bacterium]